MSSVLKSTSQTKNSLLQDLSRCTDPAAQRELMGVDDESVSRLVYWMPTGWIDASKMGNIDKEIGYGYAELDFTFKDRPRLGTPKRRFRMTMNKLFATFGEYWGTGFSLWSVCAKGYTNFLIDILAHNKPETDADLIKLLKDIGEYFKKMGPSSIFGLSELNSVPVWMFFVDLQNLGSYHTVVDEQAYNEELLDWVEAEHVHYSVHGDYDRQFSARLNELVNDIKVRPVEFIGFEDWLHLRFTWGRSASSHVFRSAGYKNTKNNLAWLSTDARLDQIVDLLEPSTTLKVIEKAELGKNRPVMGVGDNLYLVMSYLSLFLEPSLGSLPMFNFMSSSDQVLSLSEVTSSGWCVPLDESKFDRNKSARVVLYCVGFLESMFSRYNLVPPDALDFVAEAFDFIRGSLYGGRLIWRGHSYDVEKGILSGWRWTYLLDTLINLVQVRMTLHDLGFLGFGITVPSYVCSGDDIAMRFSRLFEAIRFIVMHSSYGYKINVSKFWVDRGRNEFLRKVYFPDGRGIGYVTRMLSKLLFSGPLNSAEYEDVILATSASWSELVSRGFPMDVAKRNLQSDIMGITKLSARNVWLFMHTPSCYGGLGCAPLQLDVGLVPVYAPLELSATARASDSAVRSSSDIISKLYPTLPPDVIKKAVTAFADSTIVEKSSKTKVTKIVDFKPVVIADNLPKIKLSSGILIRPVLYHQIISPIVTQLYTTYRGDIDADFLSILYKDTSFLKFINTWSRKAQIAVITGDVPSTNILFADNSVQRSVKASRIYSDSVVGLRNATWQTLESLGLACVIYASSCDMSRFDLLA